MTIKIILEPVAGEGPISVRLTPLFKLFYRLKEKRGFEWHTLIIATDLAYTQIVERLDGTRPPSPKFVTDLVNWFATSGGALSEHEVEQLKNLAHISVLNTRLFSRVFEELRWRRRINLHTLAMSTALDVKTLTEIRTGAYVPTSKAAEQIIDRLHEYTPISSNVRTLYWHIHGAAISGISPEKKWVALAKLPFEDSKHTNA